MTKITYCLFLLCSVFASGQNIQFDDPDLLTYLTTRLCVDTDGDGVYDSNADFNNDDQIQLSEAQQVLRFRFNSLANGIQDLGGFENFSNLIVLEVTTIDVNALDFSVWPSLQTLKLSSSIDSFTFNNPVLTHFELQNVGFNNPTFDLTNLPSLEYVRIQSNFINDSIIFGTHNNLEELRILAGTYSSLNLMGMPALKYLTINDFTGTSINISNCTLLEEFLFRYTADLIEIIGDDASTALEKIDFIQDDYLSTPSSLDIAFNHQALVDVSVRGANSFSLSNNTSGIGAIDLYFLNGYVNIDNSSFVYIDSALDGVLTLVNINSDDISLSDIEGMRRLFGQEIISNTPLDLSTVGVERINLTTSNLAELNLKNGDSLLQFNSSFDTVIPFICIDQEELNVVENGYSNTDSPAVIHPYCTFVLGGDYYEITGDLLVDLGSGCLPYTAGSIFDVQFTVMDNSSLDRFYTDNLNAYSYTLPEGNHVLSSQLIETDFWTISPSSVDLDFPTDGSPFVQDFCISPNGVNNDIEVIIIPIEAAIPGFETDYKIIYKNKGNTTLSGTIDFEFDNDVMTWVSATPTADNSTPGNLVWNYTDLQPFETREISFTMLLNTPTDPNFPLNADDVLNYTASISPVDADETPEDNTFVLDQIVINAFDPNDIKCLEGNTITVDHVGKYVHYIIRFENTGTANAINVVVKDVIDTTKFDIGSLMPLNASHNFTTRIVNANEVEFIFENIQLPFDDANNDGYVVFKIKTLDTLVSGDSFSNGADIYFDFNFPILTNIETTNVQDNLSIDTFELNTVIQLHPNPTEASFSFKTLNDINIQSISLIDVSGKHLLEFFKQESYDIGALNPGIYFVCIKTDHSTVTKKLIKK